MHLCPDLDRQVREWILDRVFAKILDRPSTRVQDDEHHPFKKLATFASNAFLSEEFTFDVNGRPQTFRLVVFETEARLTLQSRSRSDPAATADLRIGTWEGSIEAAGGTCKVVDLPRQPTP
jgi:hypothetical protein